jgi:hypothetical protein
MGFPGAHNVRRRPQGLGVARDVSAPRIGDLSVRRTPGVSRSRIPLRRSHPQRQTNLANRVLCASGRSACGNRLPACGRRSSGVVLLARSPVGGKDSACICSERPTHPPLRHAWCQNLGHRTACDSAGHKWPRSEYPPTARPISTRSVSGLQSRWRILVASWLGGRCSCLTPLQHTEQRRPRLRGHQRYVRFVVTMPPQTTRSL